MLSGILIEDDIIQLAVGFVGPNISASHHDQPARPDAGGAGSLFPAWAPDAFAGQNVEEGCAKVLGESRVDQRVKHAVEITQPQEESVNSLINLLAGCAKRLQRVDDKKSHPTRHKGAEDNQQHFENFPLAILKTQLLLWQDYAAPCHVGSGPDIATASMVAPRFADAFFPFR
jgi:hypothetical protein